LLCFYGSCFRVLVETFCDVADIFELYHSLDAAGMMVAAVTASKNVA